jgi:hypothetical protein
VVKADGFRQIPRLPAWTQRVAINLKELLPIQNPKQSLRLIGSVEGIDIIFVNSLDLGIYEINLKSLQWKKIWKAENFHALFPYMSFHNPPGILISTSLVFENNS